MSRVTPDHVRVEYFGGPWDGRRDDMTPATLTQRRHMPGRTDNHPCDLVTYELEVGHRYTYRPVRAASREDTP